MLQILIPMAGKGSRFEKAGYTFPKPLIDVRGEPMISLVTRNLLYCAPTDISVTYICQKEHYEKYDLKNVLEMAVRNTHPEAKVNIIQIEGITQGAACTALMAKDVIDPEEPLMIANSDQWISPDEMQAWHDYLEHSVLEEGVLMTFNSTHPKWSYARINEKGLVVEVAEKQVISGNATTGIYWWGKAGYFLNSAESIIKKDIRYNGEFYIAPTYNEMLLEGKEVSIFTIPDNGMLGLGTPEDLNKYLNQ